MWLRARSTSLYTTLYTVLYIFHSCVVDLSCLCVCIYNNYVHVVAHTLVHVGTTHMGFVLVLIVSTRYVFALHLEVVPPPTGTHSASVDTIDLLAGAALPPAQSWPPGTILSVIKQSQIGPYRMVENVTLGAQGRFTVTSNMTAAFDNVNGTVNFLYPAMSMFAQPFVKWVAKCVNGTMLSGTFAHDDSFTLRSDIEWAAVYDGVSRGAVYQCVFFLFFKPMREHMMVCMG